MKMKASVAALGLTSTLVLYGCGGDDSSSTTSSTGTSYSVKAIDGYLNGALVWLDINKNFELDDGEPRATSGVGGEATLDTTGIPSPESYPLVVKSIANTTIDEDDGETVPNDFILSAPAGVAQVTPLTTLVHIKVLASDGALSADDAKSEVATALGIDEDLMYSDYKAESSTVYKVVAFAAKSLVTSGVIPETVEEIADAAEDTDGDNALLNAVATVASGIHSTVSSVDLEGDGSELDNVVINNSGQADSDSDGDGVPDADDFEPYDKTEWKDTDGDNVGDNSDAFPKDSSEWLDTDKDGYGDNSDAFIEDPTEWLDTDGDKTGNNADLDDDNDGHLDEEDAFPLDVDEWLDTDGDKIGNNADLDDDNDEYPDDVDAFDLDPTEWLDTDGDEVGNNADTDDDGDGVLDDDDYDSLDSSIGSKATVEAKTYLNAQTGIYSLWVDDDDFNSSRIYVDTLSVSDSIITLDSTAMVKSNGDEIAISSVDSDLILTSEGWSAQSGIWAIDTSGFALVAYPSDHTDVTYTLNGSLVTLDGSTVAESNFDWENYVDTTAVFPTESYMLNLTLTPNQDHYYLWDWQPYITNMGSGVQGASSLDELIFSDASVITTTSALQGMDVGKDVYVKFIDDGDSSSGTAEYYSVSADTATLVGAGIWTRSTINTADILEFSVPESVVTAWGDAFNEPTNHMIVSVYDGVVYIGSKETADEVLDNENIVLVNEVAKVAILSAVDLPIYKCSVGNTETEASFADFEAAIEECRGMTSITSDMVLDKTFHRVRSDGSTRDYFFNSNGKVEVYRDGVFGYDSYWSIESGYVKIIDDGEVPEEFWYWALIDSKDNQWSLKHYEEYPTDEGTVTKVWSSIVTLSDSDLCSITDGEGFSYSEYQAQLSAYETCKDGLPVISSSDLVGAHLNRIKSNGETRTYIFSENNELSYYKDGVVRNWYWEVTDSLIALSYSSEDTPFEYLRLIKDAEPGEPLTFAIYIVEGGGDPSEIWVTQSYSDLSQNMDIEGCYDGTNGWDFENEIPSPFTSYSTFLSSVETCLGYSGSSVKFSYDFLSQLPVSMISDESGIYESFTFSSINEETEIGTGNYIYTSSNGGTEHDFFWTIDEDTGELVVNLNIEDGSTFSFHLYLIDTDGVEFSVKNWSSASYWAEHESYMPDDGNSWTGVFIFN